MARRITNHRATQMLGEACDIARDGHRALLDTYLADDGCWDTNAILRAERKLVAAARRCALIRLALKGKA